MPARNETCLQATVEAYDAALLVASSWCRLVPRFFFWLSGSFLPRVLREALDSVPRGGKLRGPQGVILMLVADILVEGVLVGAHAEDAALLTFKASSDVPEVRWKVFWGRPEEPGTVTLIFQ